MTILERIALMVFVTTVQTALLGLMVFMPAYLLFWLYAWLLLAGTFWWNFIKLMRGN